MPTTLSYAELGGALTRGRPASRAVHVIAVDGFSGSGKTWLADRLGAAVGCPVIHADAFIPGWTHLSTGVARIGAQVLRPLSEGRRGRIRTYDWDRGRLAGWCDIPADPVVIIEGSAIGATPDRALLPALIWLDVPDAVRRRRLAARADYLDYLPYRSVWAEQEVALARRAGTHERADVVVSATTQLDVRLTRCTFIDNATISASLC